MKLTYRLRPAVLVFVSLIIVGVAFAQSPDSALVDTVASAIESTLARSSLRIETQSRTELGGGKTTNLQQSGTSSYDLERTEDGWNVSGSSTTSVTTPNGSFDTTTSLIVIEGAIYMKNDGGSGFAPPGGSESQAVPEGWFEVGTDAPADAQTPDQPFVGATLSADNALGVLLLPITGESVTGIAELPDDTIDGQSMRVIQVTLDPQAVLDSSAAALFGGGIGRGGFPGSGGFPGGGNFPGGQNQDGTPAFTPPDGTAPAQGDFGGQGFGQALDAADISITFAVYIGADDGLLHRIYSVIDLTSSSDNGASTSRTTSVTDFSAFDDPVEITAPVT